MTDGHPISRRAAIGGLGAAVALAAVGCSSDDAGDGDTDREDDPADVIEYGPSRLQRGALSRPAGGDDVPVVVLLHGGFWRAGYDRRQLDPIARAVVKAGWAAWNLDYRPIGRDGGWPATFTDVARGIDHLDRLASDHQLDVDYVGVVGHSAGATLALWSAARAGLPAGAPGADPLIRPTAVVALAGVTSLAAGSIDGLGQGAVDKLMGGTPNEKGDDYFLASPTERLPLGVPQLLVHGADDAIVPVRQSEAYAARAKEEGDAARSIVFQRTDHFDLINPGHRAWPQTLSWLRERLT